MHADGTLCAEAPWFGRTVIRSCAKLDYPTAQRMIDGLIPSIPSEGLDPDAFLTTMPEEVWETHRRPISQSAWRCAADVVTMAGVARRRRIQRLANGALVLNRSKMTFRLDNDGNPIELSIYQLRESNSLVEEFMLLANFLVAQELVSKTGPIAFLRCHPQPQFSSSGKIDALADLLGVTIDMTSSMALQRSLMNIEQMGIPLYSQVATSLLAVPMSPAEYFVVGVTSPEQWKHYALAIPYYTHFTSPIRRYADVMVHRLLAQVLTGEVGEVSTRKIKAMAQVASRCNFKKMNSKSAQDRSDRMYLAVYLRKTPLLEEGVIVDIGPGSFTVLLIRLGFDVRMSVLSMLGFEGQMDLSARKLILRKDGNNSRKALAGTLQFEELELCVLKKVQLLLCASNTPPIDMQVHLVKEL
jgi:DIS3-like exonuclease 2